MPTIIGQCPICLSPRIKLIHHHWFEDKTHTKGHIRLICSYCNSLLKTRGENNHILPDWETQIKRARILLANPLEHNAYGNSTVLSVKMSEELNNRIIELAQKGNTNRNHWIVKTLTRLAYKHQANKPVVPCDKTPKISWLTKKQPSKRSK